MSNDVKSAIERFGYAFEKFKDANDQRLKEIQTKGTADPLTEFGTEPYAGHYPLYQKPYGSC